MHACIVFVPFCSANFAGETNTQDHKYWEDPPLRVVSVGVGT